MSVWFATTSIEPFVFEPSPVPKAVDNVPVNTPAEPVSVTCSTSPVVGLLTVTSTEVVPPGRSGSSTFSVSG